MYSAGRVGGIGTVAIGLPVVGVPAALGVVAAGVTVFVPCTGVVAIGAPAVAGALAPPMSCCRDGEASFLTVSAAAI